MARSFFVEKIKIYQNDGKTREEKENCFPCVKTGENIKNKTIFVYYEAGYGDMIMFARYLPLLKKCCKKII